MTSNGEEATVVGSAAALEPGDEVPRCSEIPPNSNSLQII
jgi:hypothetical protein